MASQSSLNPPSDLQEVSDGKNAGPSVTENKAAPETKDELADRGTDTRKSSSKKRTRKISPCNENDIPTKIMKADANHDVNTKSVKSNKPKSNKLETGAGWGKKHPLYDLEEQPQAKKRKLETDALRQDDGKKKHVRRRMKHLLQTVVDQMEFYFGDSNLSKDRFLRKLLDSSPDGYVDLSVFGNFNKLQSLHKDGVSVRVLSSAIKKSKMLTLNDDGTKVRRTTAVKQISQEEIDSRTVYVEHLPAHANHTWIRSIFCQCGKVVYVSLPVYKTTRMIKGFAFVEFETCAEAAQACMMLNNPMPVKLEEKPGKFPKGNKTLNRLQKIAPVNIDQGNDEENEPSCEKTEPSQAGTATEPRQAGAATETRQAGSATELRQAGAATEPRQAGAATEPRQAGAAISNKKKKKKNSKKKKTYDSASDDNSAKVSATDAEQAEKKVEQAEGKKKKKKKKKKPIQPENGSSGKDNETNDSLETMEATSVIGNESVTEDLVKASLLTDKETVVKMDEEKICGEEKSVVGKIPAKSEALKKKRRKKEKKEGKGNEKLNSQKLQQKKVGSAVASFVEAERNKTKENTQNTHAIDQNVEAGLSRKERKRLRQEDIRRKKLEREKMTVDNLSALPLKAEVGSGNNKNVSSLKDVTVTDKPAGNATNDKEGVGTLTPDIADNEMDEKSQRKSDGSELTSILKSKKGQERKKVEFDPVPVTNEFVKGREIRKRKKLKKEKLHLRVIAKDEWLSLKAEYIAQQKSHMAALKESLRELRQHENQSKPHAAKRVDLEDVFGTKRLKPSQDLKLAHVESLKFIPNVIVQWKCSHEMHRDKIRTMFKEMSGDNIAYIDAQEEAKFGYIRFKDETSAEEFSKLSRRSTSFMARVLPADQQEDYWKRANDDRMKKLGHKKREKGADKIARKVFERNKATFFQKPNHVVFNDDDDETDAKGVKSNVAEYGPEEAHIQDGDQLPARMDA